MKEKYDGAFKEAFGLESIDENIAYNQHEAWDSIGHMSLISNLETAFKISMDTDDIVGFESYKKGLEIMKKYNVSW